MKKGFYTVLLLLLAGNCLMAQTILGIDVSHYDGTINWVQVSAAGKVFGWAKSTEGVSYTDPTFTTNLINGNSAGVVMGAYHFARPVSNSATAEANYFLSVAGSYIGSGHLPPALDLEAPPSGTSLINAFSSSGLTAWVQTWMTAVQNQTGIAPVIYTSGSIAAYLNTSLNAYGLWIANPGTSATTPPSNTGVWTTWAFKQYSWTGTVSGINASVDLNVFNGSINAFNNLIGTVPCTAPSNDNCPGIPIVSNGNCLTGMVACATGSYGANQCSGCTCTSPDNYDVYYSFAAAATSETVRLSNYAANFDAVMELRTACALGSGNYIGCFDSAGVPAAISHTWNNLNIGQTYYIRIFEYDYSGTPPASPNFDICLTHTVCAPPAQPGNISGSTAVCQGSVQTYSIGAVAGATSYTWTLPPGWTGSSFSTSINVSAGSSGGIISVKANNNCGSSPAAIITVSANQNPVISISPQTVTICSGGSGTQLHVNGSAQNYYWSPATGLDTTSGQTVNANPLNSAVYTVTASNGNCSATASASVNVSGQLTASIDPANPVFCAGGMANLSASPNGSAYSWSGPGGFASGNQSINISTAGNYSVTITNPGGCTGTASAGISVIQFPAVTAEAGPDKNVQAGDTVIIGGNPTGSAGQAPYNYFWFPGAGLSGSTNANPSAFPDSTVTYHVIVTDANGCSTNDSVTIFVSPACPAYTLDSQIVYVSSDAGIYSVNLTTSGACPWTITESCSWLDFANAAGNGSAALIFTVQENVISVARTCLVNIEGKVLAVTQAACLAPIGDFTVSLQNGIAPMTVTFSDLSANIPTQWQWSFQGGNPSSSNLPAPVVTYFNGGLFDVSLQVANNCGEHFVTKTNYMIVGATRIREDNELKYITISPNPNNGIFTIDMEAIPDQDIRIHLFNSLGQTIMRKEIYADNPQIKFAIDLSLRPKGIYFMEIFTGEKGYTFKVSVE